MRQLVLGLDVSPRRMGWGLAHIEWGVPVACGVFSLLPDNPGDIRHALHNLQTQLVIHGAVGMPTTVYIEAPHVGPNKSEAMRHALTIGSVWQAVDRRWPDAPISFVQPDAWKKRVGVEPTPRGMKSKRAQRMAAIEFGVHGHPNMHLPDEWQAQILKADKPFVFLRALELGFSPDWSQDAADAGLIAVAGALINAETVAIYKARKEAA